MFRITVISPCHSSDFGSLMDAEICPQIVSNLNTFANGLDMYGPYLASAADLAALKNAIATLMTLQDLTSDTTSELKSTIYRYYAFYECFRENANGAILKTLCPSFLSSDPGFQRTDVSARSSDDAKVSNFIETKFKPMALIAAQVASISAAAHYQGGNGAWANVDQTASYKWLLSVHRLRLFFNEYRENVSSMAMTRLPDPWHMSMWILYINPYLASIFTVYIPETWTKFPTFQYNTMVISRNFWKAAGTFIYNLPCNIAFMDPAKRAQYCSGKMDPPSAFDVLWE
jgi:hypothetical protein